MGFIGKLGTELRAINPLPVVSNSAVKNYWEVSEDGSLEPKKKVVS